MVYEPTGFEQLPDILYRPLLHLQPLQFFERGMHYANQHKYALALKYLDWVAEPFVNPDHLPIKKDPIRGIVEKSIRKKIIICCQVRLFDKAYAELDELRRLTAKPLNKLRHRIDAAWWSAALDQMQHDFAEASKRVPKSTAPPKQPKCRWSAVSLPCGEGITVAKDQAGKKKEDKSKAPKKRTVKAVAYGEEGGGGLCIQNLDNPLPARVEEPDCCKAESSDEEICKNLHKMYQH